VIHCHDWQAGLAPAYLQVWGGARPATAITIHNIAYQGLYPPTKLGEMWLPPECYRMDGVEFHGNISFLKAGLHYADKITTVSPTYAREIQEPHGGFGLDGLLSYRFMDVVGILNGVDDEVWNPLTSPHLPVNYDVRRLEKRTACKTELQRTLGLSEDPDRPLFGIVSRLAEIKGLDMVLANVEHLIHLDAQLAILGSGDKWLQDGFTGAALHHSGRVATHVGYAEGLSHLFFAGSDVIMVPSRSEPCGLTQLYALKHGALPLVRRTGGLADTVVDTNHDTIQNNTATGFVFEEPSSWALGDAITRACHLYHADRKAWAKVQRHGMRQNFGWASSAKQYLKLYQELIRRA
jgi:starch synthase